MGRPDGMRRPPGRTLGGVQEQTRNKIWEKTLGKETRAWKELGRSWKNESSTPCHLLKQGGGGFN